jgi:hypothetical protein
MWSGPKRTAGKVFQAYGVALPPALRSTSAPESQPAPAGWRVTTLFQQP